MPETETNTSTEETRKRQILITIIAVCLSLTLFLTWRAAQPETVAPADILPNASAQMAASAPKNSDIKEAFRAGDLYFNCITDYTDNDWKKAATYCAEAGSALSVRTTMESLLRQNGKMNGYSSESVSVPSTALSVIQPYTLLFTNKKTAHVSVVLVRNSTKADWKLQSMRMVQ